MYYVEDGTQRAGFYECTKCHYRFLSEKTDPMLECPHCADETAKLLQVIEGAEDVERMDALLSLAITGGNFDWV